MDTIKEDIAWFHIYKNKSISTNRRDREVFLESMILAVRFDNDENDTVLLKYDNNKCYNNNIKLTKSQFCKLMHLMSLNSNETFDNLENLKSLSTNSIFYVSEESVLNGILSISDVTEWIAYKIQNGNVPEYLKNIRILSISTTTLISGCTLVGEVEEKIESFLKEVLEYKDIILFFDEMHTVIGTGAGLKSNLDLANILKPYLDRGELKVIGATTSEEYDIISNDKAFQSKFEKIEIGELLEEELYKIVNTSIETLQKITNVNMDESVINKNNLINQLIKLTDKKHRTYNEIRYNPRLILSIIRKSFSYAIFYEHKTLEFSDIEEAVFNCNVIYPFAKEKFLSKRNLITKNEKEENRNIISFSKKRTHVINH